VRVQHVENPRKGSFEITSDGRVLYSKLFEKNRLPTEEDLKAVSKEVGKLASGKNSGSGSSTA